MKKRGKKGFAKPGWGEKRGDILVSGKKGRKKGNVFNRIRPLVGCTLLWGERAGVGGGGGGGGWGCVLGCGGGVGGGCVGGGGGWGLFEGATSNGDEVQNWVLPAWIPGDSA